MAFHSQSPLTGHRRACREVVTSRHWAAVRRAKVDTVPALIVSFCQVRKTTEEHYAALWWLILSLGFSIIVLTTIGSYTVIVVSANVAIYIYFFIIFFFFAWTCCECDLWCQDACPQALCATSSLTATCVGVRVCLCELLSVQISHQCQGKNNGVSKTYLLVFSQLYCIL